MADAGNASDATAQNALMQSMIQQSGNQSLYTPPELAANGIAGAGGYVSQPSQYISGMEAGSNLFNNWEAAQRGRIAFAEEQYGDATGMMGVMGAQGGGGGGMAGMQRGGVVPPPTRSPGTGRPMAIPVPTQSQVPQNGPNAQGSPAAMARGGVVPRPQPHTKALPHLASPASRFSGVNGSHQALPGISGYDQGGVVAPNDPSDVQSAIAANPGAPALPGAAQAGASGSAIPPLGAGPQSAPDPQTVVPPQGAAPVAATAAPPQTAPADPQTVVPPQVAQQNFENKVEDFAGYMHHQSLNDAGVPLNRAGLPGTPSQYDVTGKVSPHSLPADFWDRSDSMIRLAAGGAALAGRNPAAVYASLNAIRTSYVQGHMLRWLSVASRAQLDGNTDEMMQALRNANYYLPDGKNLEVQRDSSGRVVFQDPIYPYVDSQGKPLMYQAPGSKPNIVPVNQEYIQMVGQAMLNPMNVQSTIMASRAALVKQQQEMLQAQGQYYTGVGRANWGQAALTRSNADAQRVATQNYRDLAEADLARARAASGGYALRLLQSYRLDPTAARAAGEAANAVDNLALGPPQQVPIADARGNPNLSAAAGKVIHDTTRADPALAHASASDIAAVKAWASGLVAANPRGMTPQFAASTAAEAYRRSKQTHPGPGGKPQPDVMIDRNRGVLHIWDKKARLWHNFPMAQGSAIQTGEVPPGLFSMAVGGYGTGGAGAPAQSGGMDFSNPPADLFGGDGGSASP